MSSVKTVAVVGASGNVGPLITKALLAANFDVTAIARKDSSSKSKVPAGVKIVEVDYNSAEELTAAFKGQDAVVSTLGAFGLGFEPAVARAAAAAGVKRFLPSEYGCDIDLPQLATLPVYNPKRESLAVIRELVAQNPSFTYTSIRVNAFLDLGLEFNFLLDSSERKPAMFYGGNQPFSATSLSSVCQSVVSVLQNLEQTKNRPVFVHDLVVTQNQLLEVAKKLTPGETWEPVPTDLDKMIAASNEQLRTGDVTYKTFLPYLWKAILGPGFGGEFKKVDNELLGIKPVDESIIETFLKPVVAKS